MNTKQAKQIKTTQKGYRHLMFTKQKKSLQARYVCTRKQQQKYVYQHFMLTKNESLQTHYVNKSKQKVNRHAIFTKQKKKTNTEI